jgi:hypothetical protein
MVRTKVAGTRFEIASGGAEIVSGDLGNVWEPGVHVVTASEGSGPVGFEVWLIPGG